MSRKTVNHIPRFGKCNLSQSRTYFKTGFHLKCTRIIILSRKHLLPKLSFWKYSAPADNEPQPSEKVTDWLTKQGVVHYPEQPESTCTDSSMPKEEKYGFKLPPCTDSAPKLIRQHCHLSGCPLVEEEKMAVAHDNHEIVRRKLGEV